jgi:hypothetical protein
MTPRAAFSVTPLKGGRHQRPGTAGSATPWGQGLCARYTFCY